MAGRVIVIAWDARTERRHPKYRFRPPAQFTPSFFCRLVEEVVYWNTIRLSG